MTAILPTHGTVADIEIALVDVLPGRRRIDDDWVETISNLFALQGQLTAIEVIAEGERFRLVFGHHRILAAKKLGWATVRAVVRERSDFQSDADIKLREIAENLVRRDLTVLDRAVDIARWREIYEAVHILRKAGRPRQQEAEEISLKFETNFSEAARRVLDISRASLFRTLKIASITPDARDLISLLPIADNQSELVLLASQSTERQIEIAELLNAVPDAPASVTEAIAILDRLPKPQAEPRWQKVASSFSVLKPAEQARFFELHEAAIRLWLKERGA